MPGGHQHNINVRVERGGDEAARERTDALKQAWPRDVVKHCDKLLAGPMPSSTYEALMGAIGWRAGRRVPAHLRPRRRGRPRLNDGKKRMDSVRTRGRAISRALWRLKRAHSDQFQQLYQEELNKETP